MPIIPESVLQRYQCLKDDLNQHNHAYYVLDDPSIPDSEFDRLMRELQVIEQDYPSLITADSPSQRVGGVALDSFSQVKHEMPMLPWIMLFLIAKWLISIAGLKIVLI